MAKTQTASTVSPIRFAFGRPIYDDDVRAVIEQLNWSAGYRPRCHVALTTAGSPWAASGVNANTRGTHVIEIDTSRTSMTEVFHFWIRLSPNAVTVTCGAVVECDGTAEASVRFRIGSVTTSSLSYANADNGTEKTTTASVGSTGTGWVECYVDVQRTVAGGGSDDVYLRAFRVQDQAVTSGLPDPVQS